MTTRWESLETRDRLREHSFEDAGTLSEPPFIGLAGDGNRGGEAIKMPRVCDRDEKDVRMERIRVPIALQFPGASA
jgi:hypothetical protein